MRLLVAVLLTLVSVGANAAPAKSEVLILLQGYEWQLPREAFEQLPADTYVTLIEIARDEGEMAFTRGRAKAALSLYRNEAVWQFFHHLITASDVAVDKRRATESICQLFISSRPDPLKMALLPLLRSADVHLRTKAASCLGQINQAHPDAELETALVDYAARITEAWEFRAAGFKRDLD